MIFLIITKKSLTCFKIIIKYIYCLFYLSNMYTKKIFINTNKFLSQQCKIAHITFTKRDISNCVTSVKMSNSVQEIVKKPLHIAVEGNISSGKSTLLNYFQSFENIDTHAEPIEKWRDVDGNNLLDLLYKDIKRWNFLFQNYVQLTRLHTILKPPSNKNIAIQMYERSLQSNRYCFVEMAKDCGYLTPAEYSVLASWFDLLSNTVDIKIDFIIYVRATPETCMERLKSRGRPEENGVTLEYLKKLNDYHDQWLILRNDLLDSQVVVVDAEKGLDEIKNEYIKLLPYLATTNNSNISVPT